MSKLISAILTEFIVLTCERFDFDRCFFLRMARLHCYIVNGLKTALTSYI
jgi:hypothetical protein